jgi:hypothetical protein
MSTTEAQRGLVRKNRVMEDFSDLHSVSTLLYCALLLLPSSWFCLVEFALVPHLAFVRSIIIYSPSYG